MTDIYQQGIKELARARQGAGVIDNPDVSVSVDNPLCGDRIRLDVMLKDKRIDNLAHSVRGCLLCQASASVIGKAAIGCSAGEVEHIAERLNAMLRGDDAGEWTPFWQSLALFQPVQAHKSRHGCVLLPFTALISALHSR